MKKKTFDVLYKTVLGAFVLCTLLIAVLAKNETYQNTIWSLLPPVIAISMALITKEVYSSLFCGVAVGTLLLSSFSPVRAFQMIFEDGLLANLCDESHMALLIWPVFLGVIVIILGKSGASEAFGTWAYKRIKTRTGAELCTIALGLLIFIDDYFNCLTVGNVMRPVTDKHKISREKLAYIIDSTAAPVCIIAPISSWAAAVSGFIPGDEGFTTFVRAIPFNFYALFTIAFLIIISVMHCDFGPMAVCERTAKNNLAAQSNTIVEKEKNDACVADLFIPIVMTILSCLCGMLYTGGFFGGIGIQVALAQCNASLGLLFGAFGGMVFTMVYFVCRRRVKFADCMNAIPEGMKLMAPAMIILALAWSLNAFTAELGASAYIAETVKSSSVMTYFWPAVIFLIAVGVAFATGTSWGTFGILIPITIAALSTQGERMVMLGISACLAGSVCGDHCSPISDTTILASAGGQCDHLSHVATQLPYALTVALVSFVSFILAGLTESWILSFGIGIVLLVGVCFIIKKSNGVRLLSFSDK